MSKILIRDPFADFNSMFSAFGSPWSRRKLAGSPSAAAVAASPATTNWQLPVNVFETEDGIGIEAWVPGFSENELSVTFEDGQLRIHAEHASSDVSDGAEVSDSPGGERKYRRREVARTVLTRSFRLDPAYDTSKISAHLANGVLELSLPKSEEAAPQQIAINTISDTPEVSAEAAG